MCNKKILIYLFVTLQLMVGSSAIASNFVRKYPFDDQDYLGITANFGQFRSLTDSYKLHDGIDYYALVGTRVYSVFSGSVLETNNNADSGWGKYIVIRSSDGTLQARYAHLSRIFDYIVPGAEIAIS